MGIILGIDRRPCNQCGEEMKPADQFHGPNMWHRRVWCCKHMVLIQCPECFRVLPAGCFVCGRSDEYT